VKGRRRHSAGFKAQVVLEALRGDLTLSELGSKHQLHPTQINVWKTEALKGLATLFEKGGLPHAEVSKEKETAELERKVGQLTMENHFLKKSWESYQIKRGGK